MNSASRSLLLAAILFSASAASAQSYALFDIDNPNLRTYWGYPYTYSYGPRYDPYWSYKSSYFPELYHGDGSYYGLGYSGYSGRGWYGSYWYW